MVSSLIDLNSSSVITTLNLLLKDRTTDKNIILATDAYDNTDFETPITKELLLNSGIDICPRVLKSSTQQLQRTRKKAEVFTPAWICNKMNSYGDKIWFGRENVFNTEQGSGWIPTVEKIEFPPGKSWQDYVMYRQLEITCGEAPFIVSRYDAASGKEILPRKRIGLLDRKLRIINENVNEHSAWNEWVFRAYKSVYGYEFQGDNLLIARINLLETFCEYTKERWHTKPDDLSLKHVAEIISWNFWQMDGIYGIIPCQNTENIQNRKKTLPQISLFETIPEDDEPDIIECMIYDWNENKTVLYNSIKEDSNS